MCVKYMVNERVKEDVTFTMGENLTEIDFVFVKKNTDGLCEGDAW